jgi:phosphate transport system substrate-binding protein
VQNGTYEPLARPLFVYAKRASLRRPEVEAFLRFIVANEREIATGARFVPLTDAQEEQAKRELERAVGAS